MLFKLMEILETKNRYPIQQIERFEKELVAANCDSMSSVEKLQIFNTLYFKHFKKNIKDEDKNPILYLSILKELGVSVSEVNSFKPKEDLKKSSPSAVKYLLLQLKSELPQQLMNVYELEMGNIKNRDGVAITIDEYCTSTNLEKAKIQEMISDAKNILKQKLKRRGFEIEGEF